MIDKFCSVRPARERGKIRANTRARKEDRFKTHDTMVLHRNQGVIGGYWFILASSLEQAASCRKPLSGLRVDV
jgi:hypothetical protein